MKKLLIACTAGLFLYSCSGEAPKETPQEAPVKTEVSTPEESDEDKSVNAGENIQQSFINFQSGSRYAFPDLGGGMLMTVGAIPANKTKNVDTNSTPMSMTVPDMKAMQLEALSYKYHCWLYAFYINPNDIQELESHVFPKQYSANDREYAIDFKWSEIKDDSTLFTMTVAVPDSIVTKETQLYKITYSYVKGKKGKVDKQFKKSKEDLD